MIVAAAVFDCPLVSSRYETVDETNPDSSDLLKADFVVENQIETPIKK
jgi:hypothetical protein